VPGFEGFVIPCILVAASNIEASSEERLRCYYVILRPLLAVAFAYILSLLRVEVFLSARRAIGLAFTKASPFGPIGFREPPPLC